MKTKEELRKEAIETVIKATEHRLKKLHDQEKYIEDYIVSYRTELEEVRVNIISENAKLEALQELD